jgi:flagellar hook-associated protein 1
VVDYAQQMVNEQSQQASITVTEAADQKSLQTLLQDQLSNDSGVNLDQEMGNLIVVQNAYAAAARVISTVSNMFNELLNAVNG